MSHYRRPADLPLIGLMGYARSGKDTVAAELVSAYDYRRIAFADPLRAAALALDPIIETDNLPGYPLRLATLVDCYGWERVKDQFPEARRTLQNIGQGMREVAGEDVWLDIAMGQVEKTNGPVVITDVRYPNEARAIRRAGGMLVRVHRPGTGPVNGHDSETALDGDPGDYMIWNDSSIAGLRENAHAAHRAVAG